MKHQTLARQTKELWHRPSDFGASCHRNMPQTIELLRVTPSNYVTQTIELWRVTPSKNYGRDHRTLERQTIELWQRPTNYRASHHRTDHCTWRVTPSNFGRDQRTMVFIIELWHRQSDLTRHTIELWQKPTNFGKLHHRIMAQTIDLDASHHRTRAETIGLWRLTPSKYSTGHSTLARHIMELSRLTSSNYGTDNRTCTLTHQTIGSWRRPLDFGVTIGL